MSHQPQAWSSELLRVELPGRPDDGGASKPSRSIPVQGVVLSPNVPVQPKPTDVMRLPARGISSRGLRAATSGTSDLLEIRMRFHRKPALDPMVRRAKNVTTTAVAPENPRTGCVSGRRTKYWDRPRVSVWWSRMMRFRGGGARRSLRRVLGYIVDRCAADISRLLAADGLCVAVAIESMEIFHASSCCGSDRRGICVRAPGCQPGKRCAGAC